MGTISLAIYIVTASLTAFHRAPFLSYGIQFVNVSKTVDCFLVAVLGLPRSCSFRREQHLSHSAACFCLRCCSKLVVLLPFVATAFKQTLQRGAVCSVSDATNPNQFQMTEVTFPFFGVRSAPLAAMLFVYQARGGRGACTLNYGSPAGRRWLRMMMRKSIFIKTNRH